VTGVDPSLGSHYTKREKKKLSYPNVRCCRVIEKSAQKPAAQVDDLVMGEFDETEQKGKRGSTSISANKQNESWQSFCRICQEKKKKTFLTPFTFTWKKKNKSRHTCRQRQKKMSQL